MVPISNFVPDKEQAAIFDDLMHAKLFFFSTWTPFLVEVHQFPLFHYEITSACF